jgi:ERCC4-type nuclease
MRRNQRMERERMTEKKTPGRKKTTTKIQIHFMATIEPEERKQLESLRDKYGSYSSLIREVLKKVK